MSCDCNFTCLFIVTKKKKKKNIKSRKIDRRKRKMLVSKAFHNKRGHLWRQGGAMSLQESSREATREVLQWYYS